MSVPAAPPRADGPTSPGDGARFTIGLSMDVAKVLVEHGYEDVTVTTGRSSVELEMHLFHFLHGRELGYATCHGGLQ